MSYQNGYGGNRVISAYGADGQSVGSSVGSSRRGASGASPAVRPRPGGGMFSSNSSLRSQNTIGSGTSYGAATPGAGAPPPPPADETPIQDFVQVLETTTAEDWRTRTLGLSKLLESMPPREDEENSRSCAGYVPRPNTIPWYRSPPSLRRLVPPLSTLLMDPRSTVVKVTCQSLSTLIRRTADDHAKYLMRDLVPTVLSLHAQTVNVIKNYALQLMLGCIAHVRFRSGIPVLLDRLAQDKSRDVREACARYLREIVMHWPYGPAPSHRRTRSEGVDDLGGPDLLADDNSDENDGHLVLTNYLSRDVAYLIGTGLCVAISDSSQPVRTEAKLGFEAFRKVYPEIWEDIVHRPDGPLAKDPRLKRAVVSAALQVDSAGSPRLPKSVKRNKSAAVPRVTAVPSSPSINKSLSSEGLGFEMEDGMDAVSLGSTSSRQSVLSRVSAPAGPARPAGVPRSIAGPVLGGAKMAGRPGGGRLMGGGAQRVLTSSTRTSPSSKSAKQQQRLTGQSPGMPASRKAVSRATQSSATSTAVAAAVAAQAMRSPAAAAAAATGRSSRNRANDSPMPSSRRMSASAPGSPRVHATPRASTPQPHKPNPVKSSRSRPPTPILVVPKDQSPVAEPLSPMEIDFVHSAASSIQAAARGMSARKKARRQKDEVEKIAQSLAQLALSPPMNTKTPLTKNTANNKLVLSPELQMLALAKLSVLSEMKDVAKDSAQKPVTPAPSNGNGSGNGKEPPQGALRTPPPPSREEIKTQSAERTPTRTPKLEKKPSTLLLRERLSLAGTNGSRTTATPATSTPPPPPPPPTAQEIDDFDFPPPAPSEEEDEDEKDKGIAATAGTVSPHVASIALEILQTHKKHMDEVMEVLRQEMDLIRHVEVLGDAMTEEDVLRYFEHTLSFVDSREQSAQRLRARLDCISRGVE